MNIDLKLDIPLITGEKIKTNLQLLLYPFYCTEEDIINRFDEFPLGKSVYVRQIIHNASITVLHRTKQLERLNILSEEDLFGLRRDYTICIATNEFTKKLKSDYPGTLSRMKHLGDFTVSTSKSVNSDAFNKICKDAENCIKGMQELIAQLISDKVVPVAFVKGIRNSDNTMIRGRIWWLSEFSPNLAEAYSNHYIPYGNNRYKVGNFNIRRYSHVSNAGIGYPEGILRPTLHGDGLFSYQDTLHT